MMYAEILIFLLGFKVWYTSKQLSFSFFYGKSKVLPVINQVPYYKDIWWTESI
jgi:hypothetical protein